MKGMSDFAREVTARFESIRPLLAGAGPKVQGAVLGDLVALWLAGHLVVGDPAATAELRKDMLDELVGLVEKLVPVNAAQLGTDR